MTIYKYQILDIYIDGLDLFLLISSQIQFPVFPHSKQITLPSQGYQHKIKNSILLEAAKQRSHNYIRRTPMKGQKPLARFNIHCDIICTYVQEVTDLHVPHDTKTLTWRRSFRIPLKANDLHMTVTHSYLRLYLRKLIVGYTNKVNKHIKEPEQIPKKLLSSTYFVYYVWGNLNI